MVSPWTLAMNDEFLQKIRIEPPPRFIAALTARVDRQSDLRRTNRTWFRHSLMAAVIGASGLAAAVMVVNSVRAPTTNTNTILHALRPTAGGGSRGTPQVSRDSAGTISAEEATAPSPNSSAARPDANLTATAASPGSARAHLNHRIGARRHANPWPGVPHCKPKGSHTNS